MIYSFHILVHIKALLVLPVNILAWWRKLSDGNLHFLDASTDFIWSIVGNLPRPKVPKVDTACADQWSAANWSSRDVLFLERAWWVFVHSLASGSMNETCRVRHHHWYRSLISKMHSSLVTLELPLPDAEDCSVHGPKCRHVPLWSTHHVDLEDVLCMRLSINPSTPHLDYEPFPGIQNLPNKLRWSLVNLMGRLGWSRHELMLQVVVPTSLPHSSSEVPFAWHV